MRKTINVIALLFFIWLVLDAFNIPDALLNFLLAGEIPGIKVVLPPTTMLAVFVTTALVLVFEALSRRVESLRRVRQAIFGFVARSHRAPRPLGRA
jgi:hypothetical protein